MPTSMIILGFAILATTFALPQHEVTATSSTTCQVGSSQPVTKLKGSRVTDELQNPMSTRTSIVDEAS